MPRPSPTQPLSQDLRNQSFREMTCEGWDFSGRDIRGCNFSNTKLNGANFSGAISGKTTYQITYYIIFAGIASFTCISSFLLTFDTLFSFSIKTLDTLKGLDNYFRIIVTTFEFVSAVAGIVTVSALVGTFISLFIITMITMDYKDNYKNAHKNKEFAAIELMMKSSPWAATIAITISCLFSCGFVIFKIIRDLPNYQSIEKIILIASSLVFLFFANQVMKISCKLFHEIPGTDFEGADLKLGNFTASTIEKAIFDGPNKEYVNWTEAKVIGVDPTSLSIQTQLLISRDGKNGKYLELDLSDQHLVEVELNHANLNGADLTRSNLQDARLDYANLSNVKAGGTDLRRATLTGVCIQNWTVNNDTQFDNLICDYIYLTPDQNKQNRRPLSGSFEPGDFEKLVDKFADTLDFILRRGTDPIVFRQSLNQFIHDNPKARIKAILDLDFDRVLVQATVPEGSDKVRIYEEFNSELQLQEQTIKHLEGTIARNDRMIDGLINRPQPTIQLLQANNPTGTFMPSNYVQAGRDAIVAGDNTQGVVGKDMTGVAGRDISGTLNLNLNALRETEDPKDKELVALIEQLRKAIESPDCDLDDRFKKRSIEYLNTLTELAKDKPEGFLKSAKENLDDLTDIADKGSKLVTFAEKHLPTFMMAIGALRLWFGI